MEDEEDNGDFYVSNLFYLMLRRGRNYKVLKHFMRFNFSLSNFYCFYRLPLVKRWKMADERSFWMAVRNSDTFTVNNTCNFKDQTLIN